MTEQVIRDGLEVGNVLVHCYFGKSRSVTIVINFLMKNRGLTFDEA